MIRNISRVAISTPQADFWLASGVSILISVGLIISYAAGSNIIKSSNFDLSYVFLLQALINWPHFIASYRTLYSQKQNISKYPKASTLAPATLIIIVLIIWSLPKISSEYESSASIAGYAFYLIGVIYLAWHYIGQAWGTFSVFSRLGNTRWTTGEALWLKYSMQTLIIFHIILLAPALPNFPQISILQNPYALKIIGMISAIAFLIGLFFILRRHFFSEKVDIRIIGSWVSIFLWYALLYISVDLILLVQLFHALQYLLFVGRVEYNDAAISNKNPGKSVYKAYAVSFVIGVFVFGYAELDNLSDHALPTFIGLLAISINIHHYFIDAAIWKLRQSNVRKRLFHHLEA